MLVEVLVAVVVMAGFVAVVLPYAGQLLARWRYGEASIAKADAWIQVAARLESDLSQAIPILAVSGGGEAIAFRLGPDSVQFVRPSAYSERSTALDVVRFALSSGPSGNQIGRSVRSFDPAAPFTADRTGGAESILLDGLPQASFVAIDAKGERQTSWTATEQLPSAVELSLRAGNGTSASVMRLVFPIAAGKRS